MFSFVLIQTFHNYHNNMNGFRLVGDLAHIFATIVLLSTLLCWKKSAKGISGKSQLLYGITYVLRYADLFFNFVSVYNSVVKIYYLCISYALLHLIYITYHASHDRQNDSFRIEFLLLPVSILTLFVNHDTSLLELCWTWSIYMEALALIPQFYMIWKSGLVEAPMVLYIFLMTLYRGMYICNWVFRYYHEGYYDLIASIAGIVETTVAMVGLLAVIALCIRRGGCGQLRGQREPTIYTLPGVEEQFQKSCLGVDILKSNPNKMDDMQSLVQP